MSLITLCEIEQRIEKQKLEHEKWSQEKYDRDNQTILQMAMLAVGLIEEAMKVGQYVEDYVKVSIPKELATPGVLDVLSRYYVLQQRSLAKDNNVWYIQFK